MSSLEDRVTALEQQISQISVNIGIITNEIHNINLSITDIKNSTAGILKDTQGNTIDINAIKVRHQQEDSIKSTDLKKFALYLTMSYTAIFTIITLIIRVWFRV